MTAAAQPAKVEDFSGYQLWADLDGTLHVTFFEGGRMFDAMPDDETAKQAPGFYTLAHEPTPKPV